MIGDLQRSKAPHYFDLLDEDENGLVDAGDFEHRAERLADARNVTDEGTRSDLRDRVLPWWKHLCAVADVDDDERVTREEWETYWEALRASVDEDAEEENKTIQRLERAARGTFQAMDTTPPDHITEKEYAQWLKAWDVDESAAAFEQLDRNNTEDLTEEDLIKAVKEFYLSNDPNAPRNALYGKLPE